DPLHFALLLFRRSRLSIRITGAFCALSPRPAARASGFRRELGRATDAVSRRPCAADRRRWLPSAIAAPDGPAARALRGYHVAGLSRRSRHELRRARRVASRDSAAPGPSCLASGIVRFRPFLTPAVRRKPRRAVGCYLASQGFV